MMKKKERRNIIFVVAGVGVSRLGTALYSFAIGLYVLNLTGSGQSFAISLVLSVLPRVIAGPFLGNITDRMSKKALIVGADFVSAFLMGFLVFISYTHSLKLFWIYLVTPILSLTEIMLETAFTASQRDMVTMDSLTLLSSLRQSVISLVTLLSPLVAGLIYVFIPLWIFLAINGISFFLSALSELFIDFRFNCSEVGPDEEQRKPFMSDLREGLEYFKSDSLLVYISLSVMLLNFFFSSLTVLLPYGLIEYLKLPENLYGAVMSALSGGAFLGAIIAGKLHIRLTRRHMISTLAMIGLLFLLTGMAFSAGKHFSSLTAALIITPFPLLAAAVAMIVNIPIGVFFQAYVDRAYLGRVGSLTDSLCEGIIPIAYLLFGFLTKNISPAMILSTCGIFVLLLLGLMGRTEVLRRLDLISYGESE